MKTNATTTLLLATSVLAAPIGIDVIPFPADSGEYDEYLAVMNDLVDVVEATTPEPSLEDLRGDEDPDFYEFGDDPNE